MKQFLFDYYKTIMVILIVGLAFFIWFLEEKRQADKEFKAHKKMLESYKQMEVIRDNSCDDILEEEMIQQSRL